LTHNSVPSRWPRPCWQLMKWRWLQFPTNPEDKLFGVKHGIMSMATKKRFVGHLQFKNSINKIGHIL
jgi:hypothetical protein